MSRLVPDNEELDLFQIMLGIGRAGAYITLTSIKSFYGFVLHFSQVSSEITNGHTEILS